MKKFLYITTTLFFILLTGAAVLVYYYNTPSELIPEEGALFTVGQGESLYNVSDNLYKKGFIKSPVLLDLISRIMRTDSSIKTGQYMIKPGMTTYDIHSILVSGSGVLYKITIPEGLTSSAVAVILSEKGICGKDEFLKAIENRELIDKFSIPGESLEGFLFPDSYLFPASYPAVKAAEFMVENFFKNTGELTSSMTAEEIYEKVILASIIEREYRVEKEAPLISSVFINRLERRIPLGSCATVEYVITEIEGKPHPEYLTYDDIKINSDYNTYIHPGLPPGPISNPGMVALNAAFNPEKSDYLYFLLRDREKGEHYFSKRLSEHNRARVLYLKK